MKLEGYISKDNSKGAAIFKKILEDKKAICKDIIHGDKIADLKDKYKFANPISIIGK